MINTQIIFVTKESEIPNPPIESNKSIIEKQWSLKSATLILKFTKLIKFGKETVQAKEMEQVVKIVPLYKIKRFALNKAATQLCYHRQIEIQLN